MAIAKSKVSDTGLPARKVRLVADMIRGRKVVDARNALRFTRAASAPVIQKLLDSACANAENAAAERQERLDTDGFVVSRIVVNEGRTLSRFRPRARGSASPIRKRSSHIEIEISEA